MVCTETPEHIEQVFICADDDVIYECVSTCLVDALFNVITCYYVFDVGYPTAFEGILYLFQNVGLLCMESNACRYRKYNTLLAELKRINEKNSV